MKKNNFKKQWVLACFLLVFVACKKERKMAPKEPEIEATQGVYVLCEGLMDMENSAISYYDFTTGASEKDIFQRVNGRKLGETANDLKSYGSKMYCVVSGIQQKSKSFVEVIDIQTGKVLKQVSFNGATGGFLPRYVAFHGGKAYVSRYDGVISRIDTATLMIDKELQLWNGSTKAGGLEGIAVTNGKLYVTNSDHPYHPGLKNQVTVIDLERFAKIKDIPVTFNPVKIAATESGKLIVASWGDFISGVDPKVTIIDSSSDQVTASYEINAGPLATYQEQVYLVTDWNSQVKRFSLQNGQLSELIANGHSLQTIYGVTINPFDQSFVLTDAKGYAASTGAAAIFHSNGIKVADFETAGLPQHAVFKYSYK